MWMEANIDGLVGPSHHFGGLGVGNIASIEHEGQTSHPRKAALQGLSKMRLVADCGIPQWFWPPPRRPNWELLAQLGFAGPRHEQLLAAWHEQPRALSAAFSSAFMWVANAATATPAVDAADGRHHFTPANLASSWHRGMEAAERMVDLRASFPGSDCTIHSALPAIVPLRDEGAANHMRLCDPGGKHGFHIFVYGAIDEELQPDWKFLPRQTRAASLAIARRHRIAPERLWLLQQHPAAISAGVFHNDVIATSHLNVLLHHELAFLDGERELERLEVEFRRVTGLPMLRRVVSNAELPLEDAVQSYFFNSQLLTPRPSVAFPDDVPRMLLVCPQQCQENAAAGRLIENLLADPQLPIDAVRFVDVDESMAGGGGPACLRLRVWTDQAMRAAFPARWKMTQARFEQLTEVIEQWYPERLTLRDLADLSVAEQIDEASERIRRALEQD